MSEKKPREFWINNSSNVDNFDREFWMAFKIPNHPDSGEVHVIEKSAYDELVRALEIARKALKFYASGDHQVGMRDVEIRQCSYSGTEDHHVGKIAREALKQAVVSRSGSE